MYASKAGPLGWLGVRGAKKCSMKRAPSAPEEILINKSGVGRVAARWHLASTPSCRYRVASSVVSLKPHGSRSIKILVFTTFEPLRDDPRFHDLLLPMNLMP